MLLEKAETKAQTLAGAFYESGYVGHDEAVPIYVHHSQIGVDGSKMIIGYLGLCTGSHRQKRRFSHIWKTHKAHISDQLHFKDDLSFP